jgi:uncharacterized protein YcnI
MNSTCRMAVVAVLTCCTVFPVSAHVGVRPKESPAGATQQYTMRVPTEKAVPTVRIELDVPAAVELSTVDDVAGWKVELKKDSAGKIIGVVWSGSSIAPREAGQFTFTAQNPREQTTIAWKVVQVYEDGTRSEWTGPQGSRTPASVTMIRADAATAGPVK